MNALTIKTVTWNKGEPETVAVYRGGSAFAFAGRNDAKWATHHDVTLPEGMPTVAEAWVIALSPVPSVQVDEVGPDIFA